MSKVRSRGWCFTINNPTFEDCLGVLDLESTYIVIGFEVGKEGTEHIQGYCHYPNAVVMSTVKKCIQRAHLEAARGTPKQNYDYCTKDGIYFEFGTFPQQGKCSFEYIEQVMEDPTINFQVYNQYRRSYEAYKKTIKEVNTERELIFIKADDQDEIRNMHECEIFYDSDIDTYDGESVVMLDAFGHGSFQVLKWMKGYPKRIKRGYELIKVNPQYVYILYNDNGELAHIKNCFSSIEYRIWSKVCVNQEDLDLIENPVMEKQEDIKEDSENYDLLRR